LLTLTKSKKMNTQIKFNAKLTNQNLIIGSATHIPTLATAKGIPAPKGDAAYNGCEIAATITDGTSSIDATIKCERGTWMVVVTAPLYDTILADIAAAGISIKDLGPTPRFGVSDADAQAACRAAYKLGAQVQKMGCPIEAAKQKAANTKKRVLIHTGAIETVSRNGCEAVGRRNTYVYPNGEIKVIAESTDFE